MTARRRPTGKAERRDRVALARLWALLYRSVRRTSTRADELTARVAALELRSTELHLRLVALEFDEDEDLP